MNRKLILSIFVIGLVLSLTSKTSTITSSSRVNQTKDSFELFLPLNLPKLFDLSFTLHEPILITNNNNFTDYGFPGYGNKTHPYIIEGYNITTAEDYGIHITKTTKYFEINDCFVDAKNIGIHIDDIAEGTASIINNTCINNNENGIKVKNSSNSTLINNTCINNFNSGIVVTYSPDAVMINNTCMYSEAVSIAVGNSPGIFIANNTCSYCEVNAFSISFSSNATVINNNFFNGGVNIYDNDIVAYSSYTIVDNWVNEKKLGFFTNLVKTTLSDPIYGQLILINCTETKVANQNLFSATTGLYLRWCNSTLLLNNTSTNNYDDGIKVDDSVNTTLINNTFNDNRNGFYFTSSYNNTLINNTCNYNGNSGIYLRDSVNSTLNTNMCSNNGQGGGICLRDSLYSDLIKNNCSFNWRDGIYLWSSTNSTLTNNTCNNNYICGIYGLRADDTTLLNNSLVLNRYDGIRLSTSDFCLIIYNFLKENTGYGIKLEYSSDNNIIHHNTFINNNPGDGSQAADYGSNNVWYNVITNEGNWWDDWTGGDYAIEGSASSIDPYPLGIPVISEFLHLSIFTVITLFYFILVAILFKKGECSNKNQKK